MIYWYFFTVDVHYVITPSLDDDLLCFPPNDQENTIAEQKGTVISSLKGVLDIVDS
jgi:hypothetical protein